MHSYFHISAFVHFCVVPTAAGQYYSLSLPPPALEMEGMELQFLPAVRSICFSLPLDSADDDLALELPETTPLRLSLPPGILAGDIATAAVVVVDDDCMSYSIH